MVTKIILILRQLKIEDNPLSLFSHAAKNFEDVSKWDDMDYEILDKRDLVDGYEVNIFDTVPQSVTKGSDYLPRFTVEKKFLDKYFIGDRKPGDVGIIEETSRNNSIFNECKFSDEITKDYFYQVYNFYINIKKNNSFYSDDIKYALTKNGLDKVIDILNTTNRDLKLKELDV